MRTFGEMHLMSRDSFRNLSFDNLEGRLLLSGVVGDGAAAIEFTDVDDWGSGFHGKFRLLNDEKIPLENWRLEFDLPSDITDIWNAIVVSRDGDHYIVEHAPWNGTIGAKQEVTFGFIAGPGNLQQGPTNLIFNGIPVEEDASESLLLQLSGAAHAGNAQIQAVDAIFDDSSVIVPEFIFQVTSDSGGGIAADTLITNTTTETISDWTIEFDFDGEITNLWSAEAVSHVGNHYVLRNTDWNTQIAPGQTIKFSFQATAGPETHRALDNVLLNGVLIDELLE
jgi:hypothetical protein